MTKSEEYRSPNDERAWRTRAPFRHSGFGFLSSFGIRHWSFVNRFIVPMRAQRRMRAHDEPLPSRPVRVSPFADHCLAKAVQCKAAETTKFSRRSIEHFATSFGTTGSGNASAGSRIRNGSC